MFVTKTTANYKIEIPSSFKGYKVIDKIYTGVYAALFKVQKESTNEYFTAKIFPKKEGFDFYNLNRMIKNEIKVLSLVSHQNIIKMHETFDLKVKKRQSYIVIIEEYCSRDLFSYIKERGFQNEEEKRNIIKGIIEGINYLHEHHIAHCDIKTENILLDDNNLPKICDFNMSEFIYKSHECYDPKGTKYYSSPELFNIEQINTLNYFKCDIWSVGIALYFISENDLPYEVPDDWAKGRLKINMKDKSLQRIVEKCTLAESKRRPTAKELLNDKYFEYDDEIENMFIITTNSIQRFDSLPEPNECKEYFDKKSHKNICKYQNYTLPKYMTKESFQYSTISNDSSYSNYSNKSSNLSVDGNEICNDEKEKENQCQKIIKKKRYDKKKNKRGKQCIKRKLLISFQKNHYL